MATKKKATKSTPESVEHPEVSCPFPEHWRVDLESAQTEAMKARTPANAGLPVFSTRALEHGMKAFGAAGLRKGFAWNSQMDLAWALGYPMMTFVVDGGLESETLDDVLAFFGKSADDISTTNSLYAFALHRRFIPRRAAYAILHELEHGASVADLSDEEFLKVTEPREISLEEATKVLSGLVPTWIGKAALMIEALAGPSLTAGALVDCFEADPHDEKGCATKIAGVLKALSRRLPIHEFSSMYDRTSRVNSFYTRPEIAGQSSHNKGWFEDVIDDYQWVDGKEDEVFESFKASVADGVGDIPQPRYLFAGDDRLVEAQVALLPKYMGCEQSFFDDYSTVCNPLLATIGLRTLSKKNFREGMTLWFQRHAEHFRPVLESLQADAKSGKKATALLKKLK